MRIRLYDPLRREFGRSRQSARSFFDRRNILRYAWLLLIVGLTTPALNAQGTCEVTRPTASMSVKHVKSPGSLSADPQSSMWQKVKSVSMIKDCSKNVDYPDLKTEIRGFWSNTDLYLLFVCPYRSLNVFLPAQNTQPRRGLWDRDVVEMFLGDDWDNIRHYREYEIAPTGDWIDLAIDLDHRGLNRDWRPAPISDCSRQSLIGCGDLSGLTAWS